MQGIQQKIKQKWDNFKKKSPKGYWFIHYIIYPSLWFMLYFFVQSVWLTVNNTLINICILIITGLTYWYIVTHPIIKPQTRTTILQRLRTLVVILILLLVANMVFGILMNATNQASANQIAINEIFKFHPIKMLILAIIIGPIFEETVFRRGFISFKKKYLLLSYAISTLIFALAHMEQTPLTDVWTLTAYIMPGLAFGGEYIISKRIQDSILLHICYNLAAAIPIIVQLIK